MIDIYTVPWHENVKNTFGEKHTESRFDSNYSVGKVGTAWVNDWSPSIKHQVQFKSKQFFFSL